MCRNRGDYVMPEIEWCADPDDHEAGSEPGCHNCQVYLADNHSYNNKKGKKIMELDLNDPFDSAVAKLVAMNRKKRADYAADSDWASNFRDVAGNLALSGFGPPESALVLLLTKIARLRSLRLNGRMEDPSNESVLDTYLDLAVYSVIVFALVSEAADIDPGIDYDPNAIPYAELNKMMMDDTKWIGGQ